MADLKTNQSKNSNQETEKVLVSASRGAILCSLRCVLVSGAVCVIRGEAER